MITVETMLRSKAPGIVSIDPDATVFDALTLMAERDIGALLVMDGPELIGMFSERDYARKVILLGKSSKSLSVRDIMTTEIYVVRPDQSASECMELMTERRCRHLPVVRGERIIGLVSIGDVVKNIVADQQFHIEQLEHYIAGV